VDWDGPSPADDDNADAVLVATTNKQLSFTNKIGGTTCTV